MGNSEHKDKQIQSQPVFHPYLHREYELKDLTPTKNNTNKRDVLESFMDKMKKC